MVRNALLRLLNLLSPPEQPTEQEYRAWAWEKATKERGHALKLCYAHGGEPVELRCVSEGVWVCDRCRQATRPTGGGAYERPEKSTDPVQRIPNPHGTYFLEHRHDFLPEQDTKRTPAIPRRGPLKTVRLVYDNTWLNAGQSTMKRMKAL